MRILFTTWAWASHFYPMVPLAWALQSAGHDVMVASPPTLTDLITQSGLASVAVGSDVDFVEVVKRVINFSASRSDSSSQDWQELRMSRGARSLGMFATVAEAMVAELIEFAACWRPDLIVYDATTYAGPLAATQLGKPGVRHLFGPDMMWRGQQFEQEVLEPLCARLGIDEVDTVGVLTVDSCPPSLQIPTTSKRRTMRYVPYNGSGGMPYWLLEEPIRPRICLTSGTSIPSFGQQMQFIPQVARALAGSDLEIVVAISARHRGVLGTLPEQVRVVESLPLRLLLPTCAAVIHHGGAGTTLTSLLNGLPQLVVAQLPDQVFTSGRLLDTGAARRLMREELTTRRIIAELTAVLDEPCYAKAAMGLRDEILAQPSPADVVHVLEELA